MKKTLLLALLALAVALLLPLAEGDRHSVPLPLLAAPATPPEAAGKKPSSSPEESLPAASPPPAAPREIRVLLPDGSVQVCGLEDYVYLVTAGEMPASFAPEALKAQTVAARSYALYCAATGKHAAAGADVCTQPACCQAMQSEDALRERWGADYETYAGKLRAAAAETAGEWLCYGGEPILAAFHASSAGATEDSGAVWSSLPYLVSVSSPESAETVPGFVTRLECAPLDFRDTLLSALPEADLSGEPETWLGALTRDASGRVAEAVLGGQRISGTRLRTLFSLRSTAFTLAYQDGRFVFTVQGNGHGVGMSQYGAELLARSGADYREILAHYYPGAELTGD